MDVSFRPFSTRTGSSVRWSFPFLLPIIFLIILCLAGCMRTRSLLGGRMILDIAIADDANRNSPIAVDLVMVYDEQTMNRLLQLSARQWFAERTQIKKDNLDASGLTTYEWEWVPGQMIGLVELPLDPKAEAGILFANYLVPGAHRFRIDPGKDWVIRLYSDTVSVEPMN